MKKVILFSALALSAVLLAGCSDKGKTSEPKLYNPTNPSNIMSVSESNVKSGYSTEPQRTRSVQRIGRSIMMRNWAAL